MKHQEIAAGKIPAHFNQYRDKEKIVTLLIFGWNGMSFTEDFLWTLTSGKPPS